MDKDKASNSPRGFGVPKPVSPLADVQGVSPSGVTSQNNTPVGLAGNPANNKDQGRAAAIARRLQSAMSSNNSGRQANIRNGRA